MKSHTALEFYFELLIVRYWLVSWCLHNQEMRYLMQWGRWQWHPQDQRYDLKVTYLLMSSWIKSKSSCLGMLKDNVHSSICSRTSIHLLSTVWNLYTLHTGFLNTERGRQREERKSVLNHLTRQKIHCVIKDNSYFLHFTKGKQKILTNTDSWPSQGSYRQTLFKSHMR